MANDTQHGERRTLRWVLGAIVLLALLAAALTWLDSPDDVDETPTEPGEEAVAPAEENLTDENNTTTTNDTNTTTNTTPPS